MFFKNDKSNEAERIRAERVKAIIAEYNGGRYGRSGEYIAIIKPEYFNNGNMKAGGFTVIEKLETIRAGYGYPGANHNESIKEILEVY